MKIKEKILKKIEKIKNKNITYENASGEILIYFSGGTAQLYQIEQWLKVFIELSKSYKITLVMRNYSAYLSVKKIIPFNVFYFSRLNTLLDSYTFIDPKIILYVDNSSKNFQSLIYNNALHIHLNHGESEKSSMYSNQCKAYDYVYVVGDAAYERYKKHMLKSEMVNYLRVGRPQFDYIEVSNRTNKDKKIILYAPTDESTHIAMRYTSLECLGLSIVETILNNPNYYLIYRPHPDTGNHDSKIKKINQQIIKRISRAKNAKVETEQNALDLLGSVDLAIFDNSSLIIDFLYFDCPMLATDMFLAKYHDKETFSMLKGCVMLDDHNIKQLDEIILEELNSDTKKMARREIKNYYLGNYKQGESYQKFLSSISRAIDERDRLMALK